MEAEFATICQEGHPSVSLYKSLLLTKNWVGQPTKAISLGETEVPEDIFMEMLRDMAPKFTDRTYHVFTNNCNTFTNEVAELVLGEGIPREIAELPREFFQTQLGQHIAPLMVNMQKSL